MAISMKMHCGRGGHVGRNRGGDEGRPRSRGALLRPPRPSTAVPDTTSVVEGAGSDLSRAIANPTATARMDTGRPLVGSTDARSRPRPVLGSVGAGGGAHVDPA